ncbi:MAG: pyridoxamine kinase [Lachnospiraceae bacterium]|nr:pyridoxamine kinase [Lachnospiraceae bacterium]
MSYKRVLTIQDISCVGQCSLTVALPILSACGVETCVLPSAVLSTHTGGFTGFTFRDLTDDMPGIADHWVKEGIRFDAIYTGYLGSPRQVAIVKDIMERTLVPGGLRIVDPAMADGGKLYTGFDEKHVECMKELCACADIILPNITEACFLTGTEYKEEGQDRAYAEHLLEKLSELGQGVIILKGILDRPGAIGNAVHDPKTGNTEYYYTDLIEKKSHGTGDCYASAFTGALLRGAGEVRSAQIAADYVVRSIEATMDDPDHWYGVKFEKAIPWLEKSLEEIAGS